MPKMMRTMVRPVRCFSTKPSEKPDFGILFDIDGVIVRGKTVLPYAPQAFKKLVDANGKFRVPTVFVTNAGNTMRQKKANQLSSWLGVEIHEDQVVMSHSPLKMFQDYHKKHVLVIGQGSVEDIARILGFERITTMTQLRHSFPTLDSVDHKRRRAAPCGFEKYFPRIEAIVLFGEPIRWETSLQLIIDVLVTDGLPAEAPTSIPASHLPILACNMDLQWMAEAPMPRFGHGAFLLCLENLFKKVTGRDLVYSGLIGKPSEITYRHSEHVLQSQAIRMGFRKPIRNIYCIGDNICTDIFGANLYNRYLAARGAYNESYNRRRVASGGGRVGRGGSEESHLTRSRDIDHLVRSEGQICGASNCYSVLVRTGVFGGTLEHSPRDFLPVESSFQEPTYAVNNVDEAVTLIFKEEDFS